MCTCTYDIILCVYIYYVILYYVILYYIILYYVICLLTSPQDVSTRWTFAVLNGDHPAVLSAFGTWHSKATVSHDFPDLRVSINGGTPSHHPCLDGIFHDRNHPLLGTPILGNLHLTAEENKRDSPCSTHWCLVENGGMIHNKY